MSIQQYVSTSSHGGMCPVISSEGETYVKYSDHLQAMEELRQEAPKWYLKPVELWLQVLAAKGAQHPDYLTNSDYKLECANAEAIHTHLLSIKNGGNGRGVPPEDVVDRCQNMPLEKLLTCAMEVHARSNRYGTRLQWEAAQTYRDEILRRFEVMQRVVAEFHDHG